MKMKSKTIHKLMALTALAVSSIIVVACATAEAARMPISVMPYYNSDPLTINVGKLSEQLMSDNPNDILKISDAAKTQT